MVELLIIKVGSDYLRILGDGFERCGLNKASVYPISQLVEVRAIVTSLLEQGVAGRIMKLKIAEEPLEE